MSNSNSTAVFQELLDEVEVGNCKFIKPHIVKHILQWLVRFAASVEQVAADLEGVDLDEDEDSESVDSDVQESKQSSADVDFTDEDLDAMAEAGKLALTDSRQLLIRPSRELPLTSGPAERSVPLSLTELATLPAHKRTPLEARLLRELHPHGARTGGNLSS